MSRFALYLDELIKDRTSENQLIQRANVGKSKLTVYTDGTEVPERRVLEYYFVRQLETFRPLSQAEREKLDELYGEACRVQPPKEPTAVDRINFLEEDLERARSELASIKERLAHALDQNLAAGEEIERMRRERVVLRAQLEVLTTKTGLLERELGTSGRDYQAKLDVASQKLAEFDQELNACQQELEACQEKISAQEAALSGHVATGIKLQKTVHSQALTIRRLEREKEEDRLLFMELVNHVGGEAVARLYERLERSEQTIAQQTETIKELVETSSALRKNHELVTQERDYYKFLAASADLGSARHSAAAPAVVVAPQAGEPQEQRTDVVRVASRAGEPHEQRGDDGRVAYVAPPSDVMSRARAHFSTSGPSDRSGEVT